MNRKHILIGIGLIVAIAIGWYLLSPLWNVKEVHESSPMEGDAEAAVLSEGVFVPSAHEVAGTAKLLSTSQGRVLRMEDFETVNGPELHIYLATDESAEDYVDLGDIKATKGNVNYPIPEDVDIDRYDHVLVWCKPFSVLFSHAELT